MKRNCLCIILALLLCLTFAVPTFADGEKTDSQERANVSYTFKLTHVSGSTYRMRATVNNPDCGLLSVLLVLYDSGNNPVESVAAVSSDLTISLSRNVSLSSGTYRLCITIVGLNVAKTSERTYSI